MNNPGSYFAKDLKGKQQYGFTTNNSRSSHTLIRLWESIDSADTFVLSEDGKEGNYEGRIVPSGQELEE